MNYAEILKLCETVKLTITSEQRKVVEQATREQASSRIWFRLRAGRITASKVHAVCHTNLDMPAISLVKSICYPESYKFSTAATKWGCMHEKTALDLYRSTIEELHENVKIETCGLFLLENDPYLGASPDGLVSCSCCGDGCIEIKCPYCHKNDFIFEAVSSDKKFSLKDIGGETKLARDHSYCYQVQAQLHVTNRLYFDLWTEKDYHVEGSSLTRNFGQSVIRSVNIFFSQVFCQN